jgi:hypothetical protein
MCRPHTQQTYALCIKPIRIVQNFFVDRFDMSLEVMETPSKEVLEKVRSEFGLNEQRVREAVELLRTGYSCSLICQKKLVRLVKTLSRVSQCS